MTLGALGARAQARLPVVGFLHPGSREPYAELVASFHQGLGETGYAERKNVVVEYRWAEDRYDRLPALVAELVGRRVDLIATAGATAAVLAAKAATSTIPIVFAIGADPVKHGLVASFNRPGGNVTGISFMSNVLLAKQLELLRELLPGTTTIGALINPGNPNARSDATEVEAAAIALGWQVHVVYARLATDLNAAFASLAQRRTPALLLFPDSLIIGNRKQIAAIAARQNMPTMYSNRIYPDAGGLLSYGSNQRDAYRQLGVYSGRILKGEKPADLPVQQPTRIELVINQKTAKALGMTIPPSLLVRADEVIE